MGRYLLNLLGMGALALLVSACIPGLTDGGSASEELATSSQLLAVPPEVLREAPPTKFVEDVLNDGVVIVISKTSQQMHVFRDGALWKTSPVSTGKRGKETPSGVFSILQKKKFHRSNLYSNAPMPFMQRLTWDGIAIHAGRLPGYPASHGCIRLPSGFASELFALTSYTSTGVIVTNEPLPDPKQALALARSTEAEVPMNTDLLKAERTRFAKTAKPLPVVSPKPKAAQAQKQSATETALSEPQPASLSGQTIQLAAAATEQEASAKWDRLKRQRPELANARKAIVPALVNGKQYYRLRASAPNAHDLCNSLQSDGVACFPVS